MNCMDGMKEFPDKYFELAIVDPPYGDVTKGGYMKNIRSTIHLADTKDYDTAIWDQQKPTEEYFKELFRVSKHQIIWGGNYFISMINKDSQCWIVWDKNNTGRFADGELAWTSFNTAVRIFKYTWNGMIQEHMDRKEIRIHPTQKPVDLYKWLLNNYATAGDKILDTHVGSASSLIACHDLGFKYVGFEKEKSYYEPSNVRLEEHKQQLSLFSI